MSEVISVIALVSTFILGILQWRSSAREQASKEKTTASSILKTNTEREDLEDRITERVLQRAEAEINKLREENEKLRADNADQLRMMRAIRVLTIRLVRKMEEAGIEPDLTDEEREALFDTSKLKQYSKK